MFVYFRNMHVRTYTNIVFKPLARIHCGSAQPDTFQLRIRVKMFLPPGLREASQMLDIVGITVQKESK